MFCNFVLFLNERDLGLNLCEENLCDNFFLLSVLWEHFFNKFESLSQSGELHRQFNIHCRDQSSQYGILIWWVYSRPDQSMKSIIDNNRWQLIIINRLISEIEDQSMAKKFVFFNCHRLLSIVIDYHRFPYFLGGQKGNILQKNFGEMKLHNDHKFVHGEHGGETE